MALGRNGWAPLPERERGIVIMHPFLRLITHGQSDWMDNLTRSMIVSSELRRRVVEEGLRGMTSHPAVVH
jgi:hypothetical protein